MSHSGVNTEHSGDKRGGSSYYGRRVAAKTDSRVKRRTADALAVRRGLGEEQIDHADTKTS